MRAVVMGALGGARWGEPGRVRPDAPDGPVTFKRGPCGEVVYTLTIREARGTHGDGSNGQEIQV